MDDERTAVAEPSSEPVQLPDLTEGASTEQAPEPEAEQAKTDDEQEQQPEESPPPRWEEIAERIESDESFQEWKERTLRQARREGQQRESGQRRNTEALTQAARGAIAELNSTLRDLQESGTVDKRALAEAINSNQGLQSLMGWTQDMALQERVQGLSWGAAALVAGLGAHKYGDPEAANETAQNILQNAYHEIFSKASPDDNTAMYKEIADQIDDVLQPMFKKAREGDRKRIAELEAEIESYKTGSRKAGPDTSGKGGTSGKRWSELTTEQRQEISGQGADAVDRYIAQNG